MGIISKIRTNIFNAHLKRQLSQIKATRTSMDFGDAKSIGILFDATDGTQRNIVLDYAKNLEKNKKKIQLLGFVKNKQKDLSFPFKFFNLRNVNWKMIPQGNDVENFLKQPFDILISLYLPSKEKQVNKNQPIKYISALSKAHLRVGPSKNTNSFDLIIDVPNQADLKHLIKQIDFFLNRINSPVYEAAV